MRFPGARRSSISASSSHSGRLSVSPRSLENAKRKSEPRACAQGFLLTLYLRVSLGLVDVDFDRSDNLFLQASYAVNFVVHLMVVTIRSNFISVLIDNLLQNGHLIAIDKSIVHSQNLNLRHLHRLKPQDRPGSGIKPGEATEGLGLISVAPASVK